MTRARIARAAVVTLLALGAPRPDGAAVAQSTGAGASRAGIVLVLPTSARALGMGGASAAASPDEWAVFAAPAGLAAIRSAAAGAATEGYLASTLLSSVAFAVPAGGGTLAIGATVLDYGTVEEIASGIPGVDGSPTGQRYGAQDNAVVAGYARAVGRLRVGAAVEVTNTHVADLTATGAAYSASAAWSFARGWDADVGVHHVGQDVTLGATRGVLPRTVRASVAGPSRRVRSVVVRPMLDVRDVRGGGASATVAAEATWSGSSGRGLAVRSGYTWRSVADDHWPLSLGFGAALGRLGVDYAVERFPTIGQVTHRVGLRYARAAPAP